MINRSKRFIQKEFILEMNLHLVHYILFFKRPILIMILMFFLKLSKMLYSTHKFIIHNIRSHSNELHTILHFLVYIDNWHILLLLAYLFILLLLSSSKITLSVFKPTEYDVFFYQTLYYI